MSGVPDAYRITLCARDSLDTALKPLDALAIGTENRERISESVCRVACQTTAESARTLLATLRDELEGVDVWIEPVNTAPRRLLICDMDMTVVVAETLDEVAASLGLGGEIAAITERAMHGELDFDAALRERIAMLAGRDEQVFHDIVPKLGLSPGAESLLEAARSAGMHTILVSGGFTQVAEAIAGRLGFDELHCNRLEIEQGRLTGRVIEPIVNADLKRDILIRRAAELDIGLADCCAIGDGANDRPMVEAAGLGIAYRGKPVLRDAAACRIDHTGLGSAIYFMGLE